MNEASRLLILLATPLWVLAGLSFLTATVWLSALDISTRRLPNRPVGWLTASTLGLLALTGAVQLPTALAPLAKRELLGMLGGAALLFALFLLAWRLVPGGIGGGDVKLAPLIGGMLGYSTGILSALVGAGVGFGLAALWARLARRRASRAGRARDRGAPLAPCLFAGAWLVLIAVPVLEIALRR